MKRQATHPFSRHAGIALPVVLMFMLVITIAAAFGARRAMLGEGVSRNQLDYEVARQAAEAALRDAERDLFTNEPAAAAPCSRKAYRPLRDAIKMPYWNSDCPNGQCTTTPEALNTADWDTAANPHAWWPAAKGGLWGTPTAAQLAACNFNGAVPLGHFTGTSSIAGVARQPEYIIEFIQRMDDPLLRVTARGFGADVRTEVVLQSYIRPAALN
jgi:type IV pilus assembly protein PilX